MPTKIMTRLLAGTCTAALLTGAALAAEARPYDIPEQDAASALQAYAMQSGRQVLFPFDAARGKRAPAVQGDYDDEQVLAMLAQSAGLKVTANDGRTITLRPQFAAAAEGGGDGSVDALIVTAQKREENIQDVPIAISAFSQEDLTRSQIAGGPDLITQVPNMTFTKTNFSSYSVQLRGIGTQAISATTDPAVAVAFNNTPFIRNRFFEQEFYDLQRIEVLRGPQGTLYGRNATAGVVNILSAKPKFFYEARASADVANYNSTRVEGMINIPLVEDKVALRAAGAWTKRDGFATNELTGNPIDGRDLWSTRVSLGIEPNDRIRADFIWEHFQEDDDRLRSGKQLCKKDVVTEVGGVPVFFDQQLPDYGQSGGVGNVQATFSQGCERNSLYDDDSFQTVNGLSVPYYAPLGAIFLPTARFDPYVSTVQSRDLRAIELAIDPQYRAKSDIGQLQVSFDLTDELSLASETAYSTDTVFSLQDFNRFNTAPGAWDQPSLNPRREGIFLPGPNGGIFCDPQLGCSDRLIAVDISTAKARQFSQEIRLSSDFDGPLNFSFGANFLRADSEDKYYVFINSLSLIAALSPYPGQMQLAPYVMGQSDNIECLPGGPAYGDPSGVYPVANCTYIDPNPIGSLNDQGHNYFLSKNPYKLISYAAFGELYYNITDALKVTAGLRYTVDKKEAPRIPSWTLAANSYGYPVAEVIEQEWQEPTGRLTVDWKPDLAFTDETLLDASYAHGYKAGGANPPRFTYVFYASNSNAGAAADASATRPKTFEPEFVDAFELGSKNTLLDGSVTLNLAAFYYDYKDYQISEIVDRSAFNRNFDATVWGLEVEADWRPVENLKLSFKGGYEKTRIADGEQAIDLMDRTAGHEDWLVVRPFPTFASSCILPASLYTRNTNTLTGLGGVNGGGPGGCEVAYILGLDPITERPYEADPPPPYRIGTFDDYPGFNPHDPEINNGEGFMKQLGGNQLPNAPEFTATVSADYTLPLPNAWLATLHTDLYWQSESWWRIFDDHEYNKLDEYFTANIAAIFANEESGWRVMAYVKNVFDRTSITGAFLNSDDTGLTTNVFLTEPRLYGVRITKEWRGGSLLGGFGERREGAYPFTLELGGQVQRHTAPYQAVEPSFANAFAAPLRLFTDAQNRDLDWGDGREAKLAWRPQGGPWQVSAAVRYGKTNGSVPRVFASEQTDDVCIVGAPYAFLCVGDPTAYQSATKWSLASATNREEHRIVEFGIGKDIGIGGLDRSLVQVQLRQVTLESTTALETDGIPDWDIPPGFRFPVQLPVVHDRLLASIEAQREFEGVGPMLAWDAARHLLGSDEAGFLDMDWSIAAGALFGKQKTSLTGEEERRHYINTATYVFDDPLDASLPDQVTTTPINVSRSRSVTVPTASLSLGLSYGLDRLKVSGGYRWERYFDVLDAGNQSKEDYDRTIDGPYFKLSIGFGGDDPSGFGPL